MGFFKELGNVAKFAIPAFGLIKAGKKAFSTPAGAGENYYKDILAQGGMSQEQRDRLSTGFSRELGAQSNLQRSLLNERIAATPGARGTAFADSQFNQLLRGQQDAMQNYITNLDRLALDQQSQAAAALLSNQQQSAQRKTNILGGLISGVGSVAGAAISGREFKKDIETADTDKMLNAVKRAKVKKFKYKVGDDGREHIGVIADEAPDPMKIDDQQVNMNDAVGMLLSAVQSLAAKIDRLERV